MTEFLLSPKKLQMEISSLCNALCLGCQRTNQMNFNKVKSSIPTKQLVEVKTIEALLQSEIMSQLKQLEFCGSIDEPLMHPQFFEILDLAFKINPNYEICIHTNGSLRTPEEWVRLAGSLMRFRKHSVHFSIDGLEDTHSLYRQNTDFKKILKNATAYLQAGGYGIWQYLLFPWNQHQVDQAVELSKKIKFSEFHVRKDRSHISQLGIEEVVLRKKHNKDSATGQALRDYTILQKNAIDCNSLKNEMYFLSHESRLWPCCFLSNGFFISEAQKSFLTERLYRNYGENFNDLTVFSADEIVKHRFFSVELKKSFENSIGVNSCDKLTRCVDTCSRKENAVQKPQKIYEAASPEGRKFEEIGN